MDLHWIAGNLDSDSEASSLVQLRIRSELRRKRIRLKKVWLLRSYRFWGDSFRSLPFRVPSLSVSFRFLWFVKFVFSKEPVQNEGYHSSAGRRAGGHQPCACDTCRTHLLRRS